MPCGAILREALKFDVITAIVLYDQSKEGEPAVRLTHLQPGIPQTGEGVFWKFFHWIDASSFEVSADAFATFRVSFCQRSLISTKVDADVDGMVGYAGDSDST